MVLYGPASSASQVLVLVNGAECELAAVVEAPLSPTGHLGMSQIESGECGANPGAIITFLLDDARTNETLGWVAGGVPVQIILKAVLVERAVVADIA